MAVHNPEIGHARQESHEIVQLQLIIFISSVIATFVQLLALNISTSLSKKKPPQR